MKSISVYIDTVISEHNKDYLSEDDDIENEIELDEVSPFSTYKKFKYDVRIESDYFNIEHETCDGYKDNSLFPCKGVDCNDELCKGFARAPLGLRVTTPKPMSRSATLQR